MKYQIIPVTAFEQNCSLIWCDATKKAAFIDPGGDTEKLLREARDKMLTVEQILLTHGHIDHVGGAMRISRALNIPIIGPQCDDNYWLELLPEEAEMFHFPACEAFIPQRWLSDGEKVSIGEIVLDVLHCPGHTPGHVVFINEQDRVAFVGDVLFKGSIGRTDFPGGNFDQLIKSIREKLFSRGDDIRFIPGHGPMSTFGYERMTNPFLKGNVRFSK